MKALYRVSLFSVLLFVCSCATNNLATPATLVERIGYANSQVTAVAKTTEIAFRASKLSNEEARHVLDLSKKSAEVLDLATMFVTTGDLSSAEAQLNLVTTMLAALEQYLQTREAK
jgi:hypothetical protein